MKIRNYILGTSLLAVGMGFTVSALAQGIQEVIVTAQKREESAQDIPIAIDVITGDTFVQEGIRDVKDMGKTSTELEINNNTGQATRIGMRGMQQNGFAPTGDTLSAVHIDGTYLTNFWALNGLMFDLDRVEVLAGPQGTLYGRNTAAGAVNLITRKPGKDFKADGNIEFGSFSTQRINAGVDVPVTDTFQLRVAGTKFKRDGYFTDGGGAVDQWAGRISGNWEIADNDKLQFTYDYIKTGGTADAGVLLGVNKGATVVTGGVATLPASITNVQDLVARGADPFDNATYEARRGLVFGGDLTSTHWGAMANYTHDFGAFDLVVQYSHRDLEAIAKTATKAATAAFVTSWPQIATSDVADIRFVSDDQGSVVWVAGLFWFAGDILHANDVPNGLTPSSQPSNAFFPTVTLNNGRVVSTLGNFPDLETGLNVPGCPCANGFYPVSGSTDAYAAYGQMTWTPESMDTWHFTAGLRYSYDEKAGQQGYFINGTLISMWTPGGAVPAYLQPYVVAPNEAIVPGSSACIATTFGGQPGCTNQVVATDVHLNTKDSWGAFQWRLGVEHDLSDKSMVYGSLSTGYKSGGYAYGPTPRLDPETLLAFEIGSKSRLFDNTVQLNLSAWYYDYKDFEIGVPRPLTAPFPVINNNPVTTIGSVTNVGKAHLGGASADLDWAASDADRVGFAATYVYSKIVDGYETLANGTRNQVLNEGERLGDTPRWQLIGRYGHTFSFAGGSSLTPSIKGQYQTQKYDGGAIPAGSVAAGATTFNPAAGTFNLERKNPGQTAIPAQSIWDFQAQYKSSSGNWDITAYVHNVFDELDIKTLSYGNNPTSTSATGTYGQITGTLGEPRTVGVILGARF